MAQAIATTLWFVHESASLICFDQPQRRHPLGWPADLVEIWSHRTLDAPLFDEALRAANRFGDTVVVLTEHHAA